MNFLKYLKYWSQPEYICYLKFPHCLAFLYALIENEGFRKDLINMQFRDYLHRNQAGHWMHEARKL